MTARALVEAWIALLALSAVTTALTLLDVTPPSRVAIAAGVLLLAGSKARIILMRYLRLRQSRFWTRLFDMLLVVFLGLAFSVYLFGVRG